MMKTGITRAPDIAADSAPRVLEDLIHQAERSNASDIHLQMVGKVAEVSFRLDGAMTSATRLSEDIAELVFGRIKFLARLKTYQDSLPQDGRIDKQEIPARNDIRVSTYPTVTGEKIVLRLFQEAAVKQKDPDQKASKLLSSRFSATNNTRPRSKSFTKVK